MRLKTKVLIGFVAALIIIIVSGYFSYKSASDTIRDNVARREINNFIKKLIILSSDFHLEESAESYFVMTKDAKFIDEMALYNERIKKDIEELNRTKAGILFDEKLKKIFANIETNVRSEIEENDGNLGTFRTGDRTAIEKKFDLRFNENSRTTVNNGIEVLASSLERIRFDINEKAEEKASLTMIAIPAASAVALIIIIGAFLLINFDVKRRGKAEKQLKELNENLEAKIIDRTKNLNILNNELRSEINERKVSEERYRGLFENMSEGFAHCRMLYENGQPVDWIYLTVNRSFETLTGLKNVAGKKVSEVIPGIRQSDPELFSIYSRVSLTGKPEEFEMYVEALKMWFSISVYSPEKEHFVAVFDVITERKKAEAAILDSEAKLFNAMKLAQLGHWEYDVVKDLFTFNDRFYDLLKTTAEKEGGYTMSSSEYAKRFVHPDDMQLVGIEVQRAIETTDPDYNRHLEHRIIYAGGETGYISVHFTVIKNAEGKTIRTIGANQDITERKHAEEILQEQNRLLQALIDNSPDLIYIKDNKSRFRMASYSVAAFMGTTPDKLIGKTDFDFYPKELAEQFFNDEKKIMESGRALTNSEEPRIESDGTKSWILTTKVPLFGRGGEITGILGISKDITELKRVEETIKRYSEQYLTMKSTDLFGFLLVDENRKILDANDEICGLTGYTKEEFLNLSISDIAVLDKPEDLDRHAQLITERGNEQFESIYKTKDGRFLNVDVSIAYWKHERKNIVFVRDITERKKTEESLVKLNKAVDTSSDVIFLTDKEGIFTYINPGFTKLYGYSNTELLGIQTPRVLKSGLKEPQFYETFWKTLINGKEVKNEFTNKTKDGKLIDVEVTVNAILDEKKNIIGFLGIQRDITKRKKAEEELKRTLQEKELLLKEIHHRVKNNLQVVVSLLNMQSEYVNEAQDREYFRISSDRVRAMALIHQQLYRSASLSEINYEYYLKDLVIHLFKLYCDSPDKIKVEISAPRVKMGIDDAVPCGLLINEIVTNSFKHAFKDGRKGNVGVRMKFINNEYILNLSDDGSGMPQGIRFDEEKTLGVQLIKMLSEQLDAKMEISRIHGTEYTFTFKPSAYKTRV